MPNVEPVRVAIDIETTGLGVESDSIIEIGALTFRGAEILDSFETFVEPRRALPYRIQRLTNITPAMLVGAPSFATIAPRLRDLIGDLPLVGHSVGFDASFLRKQRLAERNALLDTYELASLLLPTLPTYSLSGVAAYLGVSAPTHHRALADAVLARDVLLALEARIRDLPDEVLSDLCELAPPQVLPSGILLHQERGRRGLSSGSHTTTFAQAINTQLRMNPNVLDLHVAALGDPLPAPLTPTTTEAVAVAPAIAATVQAALDAREPALVELAATDASVTAVLVPALEWAARVQQRIIIAAASPAAARDIVQHHLPRALGYIGAELPPTVATCVEPGDYLCLHRWYGPLRGALVAAPEVRRGLAKLTVWAHDTTTGARDEIALPAMEAPAWDLVRGSARFTAMPQCAYRERGWCFAQRARAMAAEAQVVVTTHATLFTAEGAAMLPSAGGYLITDAHLLEERMMAHAAFAIEADALTRALNWLWRRDQRGNGGLLDRAVRAIPGDTGQNWGNQVQRAHEAARAFFQALTALATDAPISGKNASATEGPPQAVRLDENTQALMGWGTLIDAWHALESRLNSVIDACAKATRSLTKVGGVDDLVLELTSQQEALRDIVRWGKECLEQPQSDMVYWIRPPQTNTRPAPRGQRPWQGDESAALHAAPTHAAHLIGPAVRALPGGCVLAGTALMVEGRFHEIADRLGIPEVTHTAHMSVDYTKQTVVLIPTDAPEPNMPAYQRSLNETLIGVAATLKGGMVVLFASHTALRTTYNSIKQALESRDVLVLGQGIDGSLRQLWQNFRTQERIVLLGAGGMWEGWEAEDAQPTCLFIPRLPLPALGDPAMAARAERHTDHMRSFTVPHAALRLRQALNRLAWTHDRRNVVILYDTRVISKDYGATILNTLPPTTQRQESATMLGASAQEWLQGTGA